MTDAVMLGCIAVIPSVITAVGVFLNNREIVKSRVQQEIQHGQNSAILKDTRQTAVQINQSVNQQNSQIENLEKQTNGLQEHLLEVTRAAAFARGQRDTTGKPEAK